ncbi:MAG TPA: glycosyltransferase [Allosphingosinicella sp.]|nr:glycosyltransferase [Allosphingosinicella sp.]
MAEASILLILLCLGGVYAGYPLAAIALAALKGPRQTCARQAPPASATIILCAHNEAAVIGPKLRSVFAAAAGRRERIDIIVCDDGSHDGTAEAVEAVAGQSPVPLQVMRLPRGGKAAALRRAIAAAQGEILVFSDADPIWEEGALAALLAPFADPRVGAVAGEVRSLRSQANRRWRAGEALFRSYESAIRRAEDRLFGCISADGGLFALRAVLAEPVPGDVTDDFFLSTAAVARGHRIAFEPGAAVWENAPAGQRQHFGRRIRITVRGLTGLWRRRALLNPWRTGGYAFGLLFHKLLRRLAPLLLVPLWFAALALVVERGEFAHILLFALGTACAAGTLLLLLLPISVPRPLRLPAYAGIHLTGLLVGTVLFLTGKRFTQWAPHRQ